MVFVFVLFLNGALRHQLLYLGLYLSLTQPGVHEESELLNRLLFFSCIFQVLCGERPTGVYYRATLVVVYLLVYVI